MQWVDKDGVTRTYREVQREPRVGDVVKYPGDGGRTARVVDDGAVTNLDYETHLGTATAKHFHAKVYELDVPPVGYREVKRRARVGELVKITDNSCMVCQDTPPNGSIVTITHMDDSDGIVATEKPGTWMSDSYYVVLEPVASDSNLSARLAALEHRVFVLESQLSLLDDVLDAGTANVVDADKANVRGVAHSIIDRHGADLQRMSDTLYTREQVVELAKRDIDELKDEYGTYTVLDDIDTSPWICHAEWHVNRTRRNVSVLLRGVSSNKVYARGIAHCAPSDCFNVHIGKAIALRRALGLDVPAYYTNAPQPTEAQVGDVVRADNGSIHTLACEASDIQMTTFGKAFYTSVSRTTWIGDRQFTIIDDSHDYGGTQEVRG